MSTQKIEIEVGSRAVGRAEARRLRRERKVPAVLYGGGKSYSISISESQILKNNLTRAENTLLTFKSESKDINNQLALVKDVVINPLTRKPEHMDFLVLDVKKAVRVSVEVKFEGKPIGLADGGLLTIVNRQVEVECLPLEIPEFFTLDVSDLGVGDSHHVASLKVPAGVKVLSAANSTLAVVNAADEEVVATPAATTTAATAAPAAAAGAKAGDAKAPAAAGAKAGDAKAPAAKAPAKK